MLIYSTILTIKCRVLSVFPANLVAEPLLLMSLHLRGPVTGAIFCLLCTIPDSLNCTFLCDF